MEKKPKHIGNILGDQFGTGFSGNVWNKKQSCPVIMTCGGGGRQPMVVKRWRKL